MPPIAPSTYYEAKAREADDSRLPARGSRDAQWRKRIRRVWEENSPVYGVHKVRRQLRREGFAVARRTVARLMRELGLCCVVRGRRVKTTTRVATLPSPADGVNRLLRATRPNALWVADITCVATRAGSSTLHSSSAPLRCASWAGGSRTRYARIPRSTPSSNRRGSGRCLR